ncbi:unnamed protein product [Urochloa decumbens]|uniref:Uncharacterized protein n=1 Tax=Urochloa decumbens TaxID=240449 RepID=A0ABC9AMP7_9POAL
MTAWPESDKLKPKPPGYVKMPGRPKKSRRKEPGEKAKRNKMSKVGGSIKCGKCKAKGHNSTTCERRRGITSEPTPFAPSHANSQPVQAATSPPAHNALVVVHGSQQSGTSTRKRKITSVSISQSSGSLKRSNTTQDVGVRSSANARVRTLQGGSASINLDAQVPTSQASSRVTVRVTSGSASAHVIAQEPQRKKLTPRRKKSDKHLLMPPDN